MTVIAWDGRTLAGDRQSTFGAARSSTTKVRRLRNGFLFGAAGNSATCREMGAWIESGCRPDAFPQAQRAHDTYADCIVIDKHRQCWAYQMSPTPVLIESRFFAFGAGSDFAMAAMHLGHRARVAVEVAIALCPSCGGEIDEIDLVPQFDPELIPLAQFVQSIETDE